MKKQIKKATCNNNLQVAPTENVYIPCPEQAKKTRHHFDRFNLQRYNNFIKQIQEPYENRI